MSSEQGISRRGFVAAGAALFALASCDPDGAGESSTAPPGGPDSGAGAEPSRLVGAVESVDGELLRLTVAGELLAIRLQPNAVLRNPMLGDVSLEAITRGMQVVAEARWEGSEWWATDLHVVFTHVEGQVLARTADRLESSAGVLAIGRQSAPWESGGDRRPGVVKPLDQIAVGDQVRALAMRDPATGELQVVRIITGEP